MKKKKKDTQISQLLANREHLPGRTLLDSLASSTPCSPYKQDPMQLPFPFQTMSMGMVQEVGTSQNIHKERSKNHKQNGGTKVEYNTETKYKYHRLEKRQRLIMSWRLRIQQSFRKVISCIELINRTTKYPERQSRNSISQYRQRTKWMSGIPGAG